MSGEEEDSFLSNVGSWAQFGFSILFQSYVPVHLLVFLWLISVIVVFLQLLQEMTLFINRGLGKMWGKSTAHIRHL